jgi:V8-like Glu-specific endopeptidase
MSYNATHSCATSTSQHVANAHLARRHTAGRARLACLVALVLSLVALPHATTVAEQDRGPDPSPQIAGGYFPHPTQWPWVTALIDKTRPGAAGDYGRQFCTASLIAPDRVLTAAHCVTRLPYYAIQALVGRRDLTQTAQGERHNVIGVAVHPQYQTFSDGIYRNDAWYDAAVLFLETPVTTVTPATLGSTTDWNTWATVMGFGHFNYDHLNPQTDQYLRAADYDLLSDADCASWFDFNGVQHYFPDIHLCANNAPTSSTYDCVTHGDSGGPLMIQYSDGSWRQIGVTSFYPQGPRQDRCGAGGPFGFAWISGPAMSGWPLTVGNPNAGQGLPSIPHGEFDLSMQMGHVKVYAPYMIEENTNGAVKKLRTRCDRTSASSFTCALKWRIRKYSYSGAAKFKHVLRDQEVFWTYRFKGIRTRTGCAACADKPILW